MRHLPRIRPLRSVLGRVSEVHQAPMMRGYAAIGLDRAKDPANLGGVLRAAGIYGASLVLLSGGRMGRYATDTMKAWKHMPCVEVDDLLAHVPFGAIPVAVEIAERA